MKSQIERLENIIKYKKEMDEMYEIFSEDLETFFKNPTTANKKEVKQSGANFSSKKNKIMQKVTDFWCKYE